MHLSPPLPSSAADASSLTTLHIAASSPSTLYQLQWGRVPPSAMSSLVEQGIARRINRALDPGSGYAFWVVRDEDSVGDGADGEQGKGEGKGEVVAYVEWEVHGAVGGRENEENADGDGPGGGKAEGERETPQLKRHANLPEWTNVELLDAFQEKVNALRKEVIRDQSYYFVGNLSTSPDYQHKGIATTLIKHLLQEAYRTGRPVYLDASPAGFPLYKKLGFEEVGSMEIDLALYGGTGIHRHIGMKRYPRTTE